MSQAQTSPKPKRKRGGRKKPASDMERILLTIQAVVTTALGAIKILKPHIYKMKTKMKSKRKGAK